MSDQTIRENPWFNMQPLPEIYREKIMEIPPIERRQFLEGEWIAVDPAAPSGDKTARATVRNGKVEQVTHE